MLQEILPVVQGIIAVFLIIVILMQSRGVGLSSTFGGASEIFSTKRGVEKLLHRLTVVLAVIFFGIAVWRMI